MEPYFIGNYYRLSDNWFEHVPVDDYANRPITYLEIGALCGGNIISVSKTYGKHPESKLYCVDPWVDYADYSEYKNQQPDNLNSFLHNIQHAGIANKIVAYRSYSHIQVPQFPDESFDMIYVDGNHESEYVLEDAVMAFRKLKPAGILIFDDYGWGGPDLTQRGIDAFVHGYHKRIQVLGHKDSQVFIRKVL